MNRHHQKVIASLSLSLVLCLSLLTPGYAAITTVLSDEQTLTQEGLPVYSSEPSTEIHDNVPYFQASDLTSSSYETFSSLDDEGRCGYAVACLGPDLLPDAPRGPIGSVKPTGWHTVKYEGIDGNYLYNRCHLIAYELSGENANEENLITGTRYMNVDGMLPYENEVADYIKSTGNHVLYRVTPVFEDDNLLASGVLMEAESVEDGGSGVSFNAYCYNVQPGISIDYATGDSSGQAYTGSEASKYDGVNFQSPAVIKAIQQALNDKGYDCGTPDGIAGNGTASAAAHFKADHGLSGNSIDAALALTLGLNAYQLLDLSSEAAADQASSAAQNGQSSGTAGQASGAQAGEASGSGSAGPAMSYIVNTNTGKFHNPGCSSIGQMSDSNKMEYTGSRDDLIAMGYQPCKRCNP